MPALDEDEEDEQKKAPSHRGSCVTETFYDPEREERRRMMVFKSTQTPSSNEGSDSDESPFRSSKKRVGKSENDESASDDDDDITLLNETNVMSTQLAQPYEEPASDEAMEEHQSKSREQIPINRIPFDYEFLSQLTQSPERIKEEAMTQLQRLEQSNPPVWGGLSQTPPPIDSPLSQRTELSQFSQRTEIGQFNGWSQNGFIPAKYFWSREAARIREEERQKDVLSEEELKALEGEANRMVAHRQRIYEARVGHNMSVDMVDADLKSLISLLSDLKRNHNRNLTQRREAFWAQCRAKQQVLAYKAHRAMTRKKPDEIEFDDENALQMFFNDDNLRPPRFEFYKSQQLKE